LRYQREVEGPVNGRFRNGLNTQSPQPGSRNRQQQKEQTRARLLDASLRLFVSKGYDGTTVRDIAEAAQLSAGLMFHYFPNKLAILEEHVKQAESGLAAVLTFLTSSTNARETFRGIAAMILSSFEEAKFRSLYLLMNQVLSFESMPPQVRQSLNAFRIIEASVPLIESGQKSGQFKPGKSLGLSVAFWGAIQGIAEVLAWNAGAPVPEPEVVTAILEK
jgi:TetR/AcrR family transcriptional regulator